MMFYNTAVGIVSNETATTTIPATAMLFIPSFILLMLFSFHCERQPARDEEVAREAWFGCQLFYGGRMVVNL